MSQAQESFYQLAPHIIDLEVSESGRIEFADRRFVLLHTKMFAELFNNMRDVAGPVVDREIEKFGENAGEQIVRKMDAFFKETSLRSIIGLFKMIVGSGFSFGQVADILPTDDKTQMEKIFGLGMLDGWVGDIKIVKYDEDAKQATFRVHNTFESYSYGQKGKKQCNFMRGVLKSILDYYWDDESIEVVEEMCRSAGDNHCLMVAK